MYSVISVISTGNTKKWTIARSWPIRVRLLHPWAGPFRVSSCREWAVYVLVCLCVVKGTVWRVWCVVWVYGWCVCICVSVSQCLCLFVSWCSLSARVPGPGSEHSKLTKTERTVPCQSLWAQDLLILRPSSRLGWSAPEDVLVNSIFLFFGFWIHTASMPITSGTIDFLFFQVSIEWNRGMCF